MDDLARELGVSRGTVAAVLRKLAAEDPPLVRVIPGYGSFAASAQ
jgi:DNA-binding GntR family transcriptional regulator